jgi:hypothetical protein
MAKEIGPDPCTNTLGLGYFNLDDLTADERKRVPMATGLLSYFPKALAMVAHVSWLGNQQHHPDKPLHWDKPKSSDQADCAVRHFAKRGIQDSENITHTVKAAWRMLAYLELEIEIFLMIREGKSLEDIELSPAHKEVLHDLIAQGALPC